MKYLSNSIRYCDRMTERAAIARQRLGRSVVKQRLDEHFSVTVKELLETKFSVGSREGQQQFYRPIGCRSRKCEGLTVIC
jgi:hypothetical protein